MMGFDLGMGAPFKEAVLSRVLRAFRAPVETHVLIPEFTAPGDFRIVILAVARCDTIRMLCGSASSDSYMHVNADNSVTFRCAGVSVRSVAGGVSEHALSLFEFERRGSVIKGRLNGVDVADGESTGAFVIDRLATALGGFYWDGVYDCAELHAGSDHRQYSDFSRSDGFVPNDLEVPAAQLWEGGELSLDAGGVWTTLNLGSQVRVRVSKPPGVEVSENGSWVGLGSSELVITTQYLNLRNSTGVAVVFTPDIRETTGGQLYNPADGSVQAYTKKGGAWLGAELWRNPIVGSYWAADGSDYTINAPDGVFNALAVNVFEVGELYQARITTSDYSGVDTPRIYGLTSAPNPAAPGVYEYNDTASAPTIQVARKGGAGAWGATVSLSIRRRIPIAQGAES
ncbi:hypothetical protein [Pontibacterium sp.]|uniref:hypothetical protein n=1 Tax=Pontibacterium sp. TaxID=2036026 RepID=UPI00356234CA